MLKRALGSRGLRGFTLTEVMLASTLAVVVMIGVGALEVVRSQLSQDIRQRVGVAEPQRVQAALGAPVRITRSLQQADRVILTSDTIQLRTYLPTTDCPTIPGSCTTPGRAPALCCFDLQANYRWDEYHYDAASKTIQLYTDTRAGCGNVSRVAEQITQVTFSYVDTAPAPPGGEPFADGRDNNVVGYQLEWANNGRNQQFVGRVVLRSIPYSDLNAGCSWGGVCDSGNGMALAGVDDTPPGLCPYMLTR